jgi:hypothetical protein
MENMTMIKNCVVNEYNEGVVVDDVSHTIPVPTFSDPEKVTYGVSDNLVMNRVDVLLPKKEVVDHPEHYNWFGIECVQVVEHFTFNLGNAIKYIWRAGRKGDYVTDLKKAIWCIQREIDKTERGE